MIIAGSGGHAKEILGIFTQLKIEDNIQFFDDVTTETIKIPFFEKFNMLKTIEEAKEIFYKNPDFVLGVGNPGIRKVMAEKLIKAGGNLVSVISPYARIGKYKINLGKGLNIMTGAIITEDASIDDGSLLHVNVSVHHDCRIGKFCELSPGCIILGNVTIGDFTSVGAGAVLLPGVTIGKYVMIGAGSVVTKNVSDGSIVKGVPAY
jgi:sugar O-acyltransferase (sialic acid O-acetyltransferase NeuD family)